MQVRVSGSYITLKDALKVAGVIATGGMARVFLAEQSVMVNGIPETRRGRKLYPGDVVVCEGHTIAITVADES